MFATLKNNEKTIPYWIKVLNWDNHFQITDIHLSTVTESDSRKNLKNFADDFVPVIGRGTGIRCGINKIRAHLLWAFLWWINHYTLFQYLSWAIPPPPPSPIFFIEISLVLPEATGLGFILLLSNLVCANRVDFINIPSLLPTFSSGSGNCFGWHNRRQGHQIPWLQNVGCFINVMM